MNKIKKIDKFFICEECNKEFICKENLSKHLKYHNISIQSYFNKWLKEFNDGICKQCKEKTKFIGLGRGYGIFCSKKCTQKFYSNIRYLKAKRKKDKIKQSYNFICQECNDKFETSIKLNNHIIKIHGKKYYYDKWLKTKDEDKCKECGKQTEFTGRITGKYSGYRLCCSKKCNNIYNFKKRSKTNLKKYGVENVFQSKGIKEKIKKSFLRKYGVNHNMKCDKGKQEYINSMNTKYGVDWPLQDKNILEKQQKSSKTLKQYKNTDLWYQGSYELDFLEKYYDKFPNIERGSSIKYLYKNKNKVYHPDFYISSLNLIIEIKSSWTLNVDEEINEKKNATIKSGFKYLMILDKKYPDNFLKIA